ncbi:MAG: hypothetical protein ACI4XN_12530 [Candidatus Kurthia intestinigallinarum]
MPQNIFKIYDGRTNFWQWDTGQKLIVLDESITEVHFSNRDMNHSIQRNVYELDGVRVCNVPDIILQLPRNLVAYAYVSDGISSHTVKSVKFAVVKRPIPDGYVMDQGEQVDDINRRLEILENTLKDIELGNQELKKFEDIEDAEKWAKETKKSGTIVVVHIDGKWIAHIVEDDYTVTPICDCDGNMVVVNVVDGGDGDGYNEEEMFQIWDGGGAAGY